MWFEKENIAPVIRNEAYELQTESLQASRSGLLPVKAIDEHPRTVKNVVYQSEAESESSSAHDYSNSITIQTEPAMYQQITINPHSIMHSSLPYTDDSPQHLFQEKSPPQLFPRVVPKPPKNMAQSSMPCVWSYSTQFTCGIAPHYTSNFFLRLRQRQQIKQTVTDHSTNHRHSRNRKNSKPFYPSKLKFQSHSQTQTMNKSKNVADEEIGRRHSLYDQFVLHRDPRLQEWTKKKPARRDFHVSKGRTLLSCRALYR